MPFRSRRQRAYLYARHPRLAQRWARRYGTRIQPKRKGKR